MQTQGGKPKDQSRAEFYLGCAYIELNRQALPAGSLSPKVASFFGTVREAVRKKP
jgi:hypothetical protein